MFAMLGLELISLSIGKPHLSHRTIFASIFHITFCSYEASNVPWKSLFFINIPILTFDSKNQLKNALPLSQ